MKLKDLEFILFSHVWQIQHVIIYDVERNVEIVRGCSAEYAMTHYGILEVKRLRSCFEGGQDYIVIEV